MDIESESKLLNKLKDSGEDSEKIMLELVLLYEKAGEPMKAVPHIENLLKNTEDNDKAVRWYFHLGQIMEQIDNYETAVSYYFKALDLKTSDKKILYFIYNNLGYCLNALGRYEEADKYCCEAVYINPYCQNAYKNLGIALEGLGEFMEAAKTYMLGAAINPSDPRARQHLNALLSRHSEIKVDYPAFEKIIEDFRSHIIEEPKSLGKER